MKLRRLPPVRNNPRHTELLETQLTRVFYDNIYKPLLNTIPKSTVKNSMKDVITAILEGHIKYDINGFRGVFSSNVSQQLKSYGAVWSKVSTKWLIRDDLLPEDVNEAVVDAHYRELGIKTGLIEVVDSVEPNTVAESLDVDWLFEQVVAGTDKSFKKSVKGVTIPPKLGPLAKLRLAESYTQNLKLYVNKFTKEEILRLRKDIQSMVFAGSRNDSVEKYIQLQFGIAKRKAKFLAKQETNLLTTKLKEIRYADVGIDQYLWKDVGGTPSHPVRPIHKKLNDESKVGKIFRFSDPPVTSTTGACNNPGQDYRCRCVAIPVIKF